MKKPRELHPRYGARSPAGFWLESIFIALMAAGFLAILVLMIAYA
jgi:hypothetical protein